MNLDFKKKSDNNTSRRNKQKNSIQTTKTSGNKRATISTQFRIT